MNKKINYLFFVWGFCAFAALRFLGNVPNGSWLKIGVWAVLIIFAVILGVVDYKYKHK
ncbi:hypothetical protein [Levilactobacillus fujinensis]|uniref:Uncharacterized protein n=1 Tax=Levilactobacillus fujinensis TaxID=2486024 RepID=A0ABW1THH2_9LACO|nr:hypothetical protein [Levilactobacillus fujinensis]